jgi:hypothetical protein
MTCDNVNFLKLCFNEGVPGELKPGIREGFGQTYEN